MATFAETESKKGTRGTWRKQSSARLNGLVMLDIDHVDNPVAIYESIPQHMFDEVACDTPILLVHVTPSGHGLRIVFGGSVKRGNLTDNQHFMASLLGVSCDEACKDASRGSFVPQAADILYINEKIFDYDNPEFDKTFGDFYRRSCSAASGKSVVSDPVGTGDGAGRSCESDEAAEHETDGGGGEAALTYHGVNLERIVGAWLAQNGTPPVGDRHRSLLRLAGDMRYICDNSPERLLKCVRQAPFVADMESEGGADEVVRVCEDACKRKSYVTFPRRLRAAMSGAGVTESYDSEDRDSVDDGSVHRLYWQRLRPLLRPPYDVAVAGLSDENKIGAVMAAGTMYCTLLSRCTYRHFDGRLHRMNPSTYIIGDPASGKSFADRLDRCIMAAMRYADQPAREAEQRYKAETKERATSAKAQKGAALSQPEGMIRYIPSRTSNAIFYRRQKNAKEVVEGAPIQLHLYTFDSELDSSITAQSGGAWIGKHDLELKAFHNELSGVDYANSDSINELIPIFWNQVITGTPLSLSKKINLRNVNDGLCSRIAVFRMRSDEFRMIARGSETVNHETEERMKVWGYYFESQHGELHIERLVDHVYELCEEAAWVAEASSDRVLDYLRKRAVFYAIWFTVPLIVARKKESGVVTVTDEDLRFATLMYDAVIYWQDKFFGQMLMDSWENAKREFVARRKRMSPAVEAWVSLGEQFTTQQLAEQAKITADAAGMQCVRWLQRGYVERVRKGVYRKTVKDII